VNAKANAELAYCRNTNFPDLKMELKMSPYKAMGKGGVGKLITCITSHNVAKVNSK